jgi:hypothetical protein
VGYNFSCAVRPYDIGTVCIMVCKEYAKSCSFHSLFSASLLRVLCCPSRRVRFAGCRRVPLCLVLVLVLALRLRLGSLLTILLTSIRGRSGRRSGRRRSASQRSIIIPGIFKCFLELPRYWRKKGVSDCENREGVYQQSGLAKRMASVSAVGGFSE